MLFYKKINPLIRKSPPTFRSCTTMVGMAQFCPKNNLCISLLKHWCMVSSATQGTFESKQFQPMVFCIELSHILWIWWAKGQFHFLTKIRYSCHFDIRNFSHLSRNFHTMLESKHSRKIYSVNTVFFCFDFDNGQKTFFCRNKTFLFFKI